MMIRLLVILIALCGILRGQSTVVETELWTIKFDASVTAPQRASINLFQRRADPWRDQQPVIITAPTGEIIPRNP